MRQALARLAAKTLAAEAELEHVLSTRGDDVEALRAALTKAVDAGLSLANSQIAQEMQQRVNQAIPLVCVDYVCSLRTDVSP